MQVETSNSFTTWKVFPRLFLIWFLNIKKNKKYTVFSHKEYFKHSFHGGLDGLRPCSQAQILNNSDHEMCFAVRVENPHHPELQ